MVKIIDASVAIKWFVAEEGSDKALQVLSGVMLQPESYAVPELFYFEVGNIFFRLFPNPAERQTTLLKELLNLGMNRFVMSPELLDDIGHFQRLGLSGYDAAYVALARQLKGRWLTFDAKAHQRIRDLKLSELL